MNAGHRVIAAIGARAALDRAMVLNGAEEAFDFGKKIGQLREAGIISEHENQMLSKLTDAGSAAAHRARMHKPEELTALIDGMEAFLHRTLVLNSAVDAINPPPRPKEATRQFRELIYMWYEELDLDGKPATKPSPRTNEEFRQKFEDNLYPSESEGGLNEVFDATRTGAAGAHLQRGGAGRGK